MSAKRTRSAADFLQSSASAAVKAAAGAGSSSAMLKRLKNVSGRAVTAAVESRPAAATATAAQARANYSPAAVSSLRKLVDADGGPPKPSSSLTTFQRRVYALTRRIPAGRVSTYKAVAQSLGAPKAYRAVGNALRCNPFAPHVPCHRVLASDGTIGGFAGSSGIDTKLVQRKMRMLSAEGVQFDKDGRSLRKDEAYRNEAIMQEIDAEGIDSLLDDAQLKM